MTEQALDDIDQLAMANADKLKPAISKKLGDKYAVFTRHIKSGPLSYIEIAARPVKGVPSDERQAAYSVTYFAGMKDTPTFVERGRRIVRDLQEALGIEPETNAG